MLRAIKHPHIRPTLLGLRINSTTGTPVTEINPDNVTSLTDNAAGNTTVTFKGAFNRQCVAVTTCDSDVASGAIANVASPATTSVDVVAVNSGGAATDGTIHALVLGWLSAETNSTYPLHHTLRSPVSGGRLIGFHVDGTGTASIVNGTHQATLTDNGVGDYTLTFRTPFAEAPVVVGSVVGSTAGVVNVVTTAVNTIRVNTFDAAGAAADNDFYLFVFGRDHSDVCRVPPRTIHTPQLCPRLLAFEVTVTAGTPAITIGSADGTIADTDTGAFTITFTNKFSRSGEAVATSAGTRIANVNALSTTTVRVDTFTNAGAAQDTTVAWVLVLGYDDASQY